MKTVYNAETILRPYCYDEIPFENAGDIFLVQLPPRWKADDGRLEAFQQMKPYKNELFHAHVNCHAYNNTHRLTI